MGTQFSGEAEMNRLSPEEQALLKAGYIRGFVIVHSQQTAGIIHTALGTYPEATHMILLGNLRAKGLTEMQSSMYYTLTPQGRTLVERLQAEQQ